MYLQQPFFLQFSARITNPRDRVFDESRLRYDFHYVPCPQSPIKGLDIPNRINKHKENQYLIALGIVLFLFSKSKTLHNFQKIKKPITLVIGFLCGERGLASFMPYAL